MSSGCGDVLSLENLKTAKKHQTFEAEVITGKAGGVASGADIDYATNQVTGQVQKTMPAVLRDSGYRPASFTFDTGGTLSATDAAMVVLWPKPGGDGNYYSWRGSLPKVIPANSTPSSTGGVYPSGNWYLETDSSLRDELASSNGSNLSLSQVATSYRLDFSEGSIWSSGQTSSTSKWWLYENKVYKSFGESVLSSSPNFDDFYLVSPDGSFTSDSFGMSSSTTAASKLSKISALLLANKSKLDIVADVLISLEADFEWGFDYYVASGVVVTVQSSNASARNIIINKSNYKIKNLTLGDLVNVCIDSTSAKLSSISVEGINFSSGYLYTTGANRGKKLRIIDCVFSNATGSVSNLISFKDWAYVTIENCRGYNAANAAVLISPAYSYTCYKVRLINNVFTSCSLFGVAIAGAAEIGCVNDLTIKDNTIQCKSTTATRTLVLQWVSGAVVTGNNLSGGIIVAAGACHDTLFDGNSSVATASPAYRKQNCSGWRFTNNRSYVVSSAQYHLTSELNTSIAQKGRAGKSFYDGNAYYNGTRGIAILSGINNTIGYESFITPDADNSVGRVYLANTSFGNSVEGDQRIIAPTGAVAVSNNSSSSVVDGNAVMSGSVSSITAIVNGAVVSSLHGKTYHFTVDINNNLNNFWSACDGAGTKKAVSTWASGVSNAKLAINASPFGASGRMQDSFSNGAPIPYTTLSDLTGVYAGCVIHRDGYMHCRYMPQSQLELNEFLLPQMHDYVWQSSFFNIPLVINGVVSTFPHDNSANPRTAIGQTASGVFHVVVVDGRNADSAGCTTTELANYMLSQGCVTAFNLDGGGSSTIWYNGTVLNVPSDGSERLVGQAWVFR